MLFKHYFLRGKSINETGGKLERYYKESVPSHGMVHKWFTEFRSGRISTSDAARSCRPKEATSREIIDENHDIVFNDRRLQVREISETVNISVGRVWYILHGFLSIMKLPAGWLPRLLTADHKSGHVWLRLSYVWACFNVIQRNFCDVM